ncbi:xanthine dehydrogenase family protein molybdopterin-binding subunit [Acuticoccus sp. M5D2P5]|uniref:xanthine dehydrogenase family protein molybdopterin-binding subunit n=1 Tax=Acuticoccus kalidii TaxID=2910977 RepID=UPI001F1BB042|nr:xanthine dehydrogenase family protein molybdopterin-binding subunit [Acuticoccus kalidii]MCF3933263.1 xanthine dehydrogenase family protein molybdopterin-binding subunit [Acuticoccus kalidii]
MSETDSAAGGRIEDLRFVTGAGRYTADRDPFGALHLVVVRSPHAHADIVAIDTAAAAAMPGVAGVFTETDLARDGLGTLPCSVAFEPASALTVPPRYALARGRVRYVGEPVAFVVAETRAAAEDAAELVAVDYDERPAIVGAAEALAAPPIWDEAPANLAVTFEKGDRAATDAAFANAAHIVELDLVNNRVSAMPMEPRAAIGDLDPATGTLVLEVSGQGVHGIRDALAGDVFHLDKDAITVAARDVGGGFGLKNFPYPEHVLVLWAARRTGRTVRWVSSPSEDLMGAVHGRAMRYHGRLALDADGTFLALEVDTIAELGAYASTVGPGASTAAMSTALGGIYDIPAMAMRSRGVFTNTCPVDAYRGAGKPEANYVLERLIDAAARRCGFDPVALRLANVVDRFPHRKALGAELDSGRYREAIELAARLADRDGFAGRRTEAQSRGRRLGLGVACFLESARGTPQEEAGVRFAEDGQIELVTGTESNGQGHETTFTDIAAQRLGLPRDRFRYVQADTRKTRIGFGHGGARSMHMGAGTLATALDQMLDRARPIAARLLQTEPGRLGYEAGRFTVPEDGRSVGLDEVARAAADGAFGGETPLDTLIHRTDAPFTFPGGCHIAEVEVDPETGAVLIRRYIAVDDYGTVLNRTLTEGQVAGGLAQGIGQALAEAIVYEDGGQLLSGSLMDYTLPRADDLPAFEITFHGTPTAANALGVKGAGQAGCISAPPTIIAALLDALSPLGVATIEMPATPERVWRAITDARAAA